MTAVTMPRRHQPAYFVRPAEDRAEVAWTTAQSHVKNWKPPAPPILAFAPGARDAMVQGRLW